MRPRLATPRDLSRPTADLGGFVAAVSARPWLTWQQDTADVVGERTGSTMAYSVVVILVPRQCGKTTWVFDDTLGMCLGHNDYRAAYTAQTGQISSERFNERLADIAGTPLSSRIKGRKSQGSERITVRPIGFRTASFMKAFPPRDGALRGSALDRVVVDEAQEVDQIRGELLDQTILPTFTTRPLRQLILIGTAGNDTSAYLARYLKLARGGAAGVAVVEYGATEDDDPADPAVWRRVHPGLAAGLTDEAALQSALQVMGVEAFAREYLNVWASSGSRLVPAKTWNACRRVKATPPPGVPPVLGVDVAADRSATAIVAVWPDLDGVPVWEVIDYAPGTDWAATRLRQLRADHRPPLIVAPSEGPALTVVDQCGRLGVPVRQTTPREFATACQQAKDAMDTAAMGHRNEQALNAAVQGAGKRTVGDGGWAWSRRTSTVDVAPLNAGSLAMWANARRPARPLVDA